MRGVHPSRYARVRVSWRDQGEATDSSCKAAEDSRALWWVRSGESRLPDRRLCKRQTTLIKLEERRALRNHEENKNVAGSWAGY